MKSRCGARLGGEERRPQGQAPGHREGREPSIRKRRGHGLARVVNEAYASQNTKDRGGVKRPDLGHQTQCLCFVYRPVREGLQSESDCHHGVLSAVVHKVAHGLRVPPSSGLAWKRDQGPLDLGKGCRDLVEAFVHVMT